MQDVYWIVSNVGHIKRAELNGTNEQIIAISPFEPSEFSYSYTLTLMVNE